jgi:acyl carrier protein
VTPARDDRGAGWIAALVAELLGVDAPRADADLLALEGFDSLAIVELVERLEHALGRALPDELLTPEAFATPRALADAVAALDASLELEGAA